MEDVSPENQPIQSPFNNLFLARGYFTGKNAWWMYVLGVVIAFAGYLLFQVIMLFPIMAVATQHGVTMTEISKNPNILFNPDRIGMNRSLLLSLMMGMFVFCLLGLLLAVQFIHHKTIASVISGFEKIRWKRYFLSFGIWSLLLVGLTVVQYMISGEGMVMQFDASKFIVLLIISVIFFPIQTATEEIFFRGYLMQGLGISMRNGLAPLLITSVLFGLMHGMNPETEAFGFGVMMPYYILFGMFLGLLTLLDEGLELAMGIHCANNLVSGLLVTSKHSVLQTDAIFRITTENPSGEFMAWLVMATVCFGALYAVYRWKNWQLIFK